MRERKRDSLRRRSSPYRPRDRDRRDSLGCDRGDGSRRFARSPVRSQFDSRGLDSGRGPAMARDWEKYIGGGRRDYRDLIERRRRDGSWERERDGDRHDERKLKLFRPNRDTFTGEVYPNRLDLAEARLVASATPEEMLPHGFSSRFGEEPYQSYEAERSRLIGSRDFGNILRPTVTHYRRGEPEPLGSINSRVYNNSVSPERKVFGYDDGARKAWYGSIRQNLSNLACPLMEPRQASEQERSVAVSPAMKSEHGDLRYSEDDREREPYFPVSPASHVGSRSAEFQQEKYRRVSLNSSYGFGGNVSNRIDDRTLEFRGKNSAPQDVYTRDIDGYLDRNSSSIYQKPKDGEVESFYDSGYSRVLTENNYGCHVSTSGTNRSRGMVCESHRSYQSVSSPVYNPAVEYISEFAHTENMVRTRNPFLYMRGPIPKSSVTDSFVDEVDGADTFLGISSRARTLDEYDPLKVDPSFVRLRSSMVEDQDETHHFRNELPEERENAYLDGGRQQLRGDYRSGDHARMYPDLNGADVMVERGESALQSRIAYLCKGKEVYLDDESQQLQRDYQYDSFARAYTGAGRPSTMMVKHDEQALRVRRDHLDGANLYLHDERLGLGEDNHSDLHTRMAVEEGERLVYLSGKTLHSRDNCGFTSPTLGKPSKIGYEKMGRVNDNHLRRMGMAFVNSESGNFSDHGVANSYREKQYRDDYVMEQTSLEQRRYSMAERSIDYDNRDHGSSPCPRIPVKERLGGRVKCRNINLTQHRGAGKNVVPWVKNVILNRKTFSRNHQNTSKARQLHPRSLLNSMKGGNKKKKKNRPEVSRGLNN